MVFRFVKFERDRFVIAVDGVEESSSLVKEL